MAGYRTVRGERHTHVCFASATRASNTTSAMLGKDSQLFLIIKLLTTLSLIIIIIIIIEIWTRVKGTFLPVLTPKDFDIIA